MDVFASITGLLTALIGLFREILKMRKAPRKNAEPVDRES